MKGGLRTPSHSSIEDHTVPEGDEWGKGLNSCLTSAGSASWLSGLSAELSLEGMNFRSTHLCGCVTL